MSDVDVQAVESSATTPAPEPVKTEPSAEDVRHYLEHGEMPKKDAAPAEPAKPEAEAEPKTDEQKQPEGEADASKPESGPGKPRAKGAELRKAQLAAEVQQALQRRAEVLQDLQMLEQRRKALMETTPAKPEAKPADDSPKEPRLEDFDDYAAYDRARLNFLKEEAKREALAAVKAELEQARKAQTEAEEKAKASESAKVWADRVESFKSRMPDYDDVVTYNEDLGEHVSMEMINGIRELDNGPAVAYHLGKNPAEAARLKAMPAHKMLIEIGRLEARISTSAPVEKAKPKPEVKPVPRELGTGAAPVDDIAAALAAGDFARYERLMDARERRR